MNNSLKNFIKFFAFVFLLIISLDSIAQKREVIWRNPLDQKVNVVQGQGWAKELKGTYQRLPNRMQSLVRTPVWNLSKDNAGIFIEFETNAPKFEVRYTVSGPVNMHHMPSTGVSGVDLYAKGEKGWEWAAGKYSFKDTISYRFENLKVGNSKKFRLYLPLYNSVKWIEIGVENQYAFEFIPLKDEKPIIVYGTSIAQGACASRPGLAWPAILGRKLNTPVVNMAFSGNGRLEEPLIHLMGEVDAKMYVLDCMPNLSSKAYPKEEVRKRIVNAVNYLQSKHKNIPILLVENSGGSTDLVIDTTKNNNYRLTSSFLRDTYNELKSSGVKNIHLLTTETIGMGINSTVDGTHPNDIGMMEHANAYEEVIREILK